MMNNKTKLFLLLTLVFCIYFPQISLGEFSDLGNSCGSLQGGEMKLSGSNSGGNYLCSFKASDVNNQFDRSSQIGLKINKITVPYVKAEDIWRTILNTVSFNSSNQLNTYGGNPSWLKADFGQANSDDECNHSDDCSGYCIGNGNLASYFAIPEIYKNVKIAIIQSCLPGIIDTTSAFSEKTKGYFSNGPYYCLHHSCHKCWVFGTCCDDDFQNLTYNPTGYKTWSTVGCGPLKDNATLTTDIAPTVSGDYHNGRIEVSRYGSITLKWTLRNPSASCYISGKDLENLDSNGQLKDIREKVCDPDNNIDWKISSITDPNGYPLRSGERRFGGITVPDGVYDFNLECGGVKNGQSSPDLDTVSIPLKIYVGRVPPAPVINGFSLSGDDLETTTTSNGATAYSLKIGKSFKVNWDVSNVGPNEVGDNASPITIYQMVNGKKTTLFSTNEPSGTKTITPKVTSIYSIGIDVSNPKIPNLPVTSNARTSFPLNVYNPGVAQTVSAQFSATKTSITKGESATLTWSADAAKTINITPDIGNVSASGGTIDVSPTVTTTYTLTATSIYSDVGPTTKVLTIKVSNATTTLAESIKNEADCLAAGYYWYDNSCHDSQQIVAPPEEQFQKQEGAPTEKVTDIKANGSDGPVTLQSPATFKLSWNIDGYCLATGSWLDVKFAAGTQNMTVKKNGKYTYSLFCPGHGSDSVEVDVVGGTGANANTGLLDSLSGNNKDSLSNIPMPVAEAMLSIDKINYSQNITVIKGKPTDIYIAADRDTSGDGLASRDEIGRWTDLMSNGGRCLYNTKLVKGTPQFDGMIESPLSVSDCNAKLGSYIFNDQPGTYQYGIMQLMENTNTFSNIAYVTITVENPPPQTGAPEIDLRINNNDSAEQILAVPAIYNVTWNVTNADSCEASGSWSGDKDLQGAQSFVSSAAKNFTYTLNCVGQLGTTTKSIALEVMESPVCKFTALPPTISKQSAFVKQSELSWKCDYADECSISPDIGVPVKTYGSVRVSPNETTTYELNCLNAATSTKFDATVSVE